MPNIRDMEDYRKQLASAELDNVRLREAWNAIEINSEECLDFDECTAMLVPLDDYNAMSEALSLTASREALDNYVAEKVREAYIPVTLDCGSGIEDVAYGNINQVRRLITWLNEYFKQETKLLAITKQRDLAVDAATKARNAAQQCASVCSKHLNVYPALINMVDVVDGALAAIKESEVK